MKSAVLPFGLPRLMDSKGLLWQSQQMTASSKNAFIIEKIGLVQ